MARMMDCMVRMPGEGAIATLSRLLTPASQRQRIASMPLPDEGHGVDVFGLNREWVAFGVGLMRGLYEQWFRVASQGHENIPSRGAAILAANHSGTLPFDAMMLWTDVVRNTNPPRLARTIADHFVPNLPFVSTLYARTGAVGGSRANLHALLERGDLVAVFPEGTPGIGKHFRDRYRLQTWRVGHVEFALRHRAPVVPVAIVGAEEQMPQIGRIPVGSKVFGAPYLPVMLTPFPLPVKYHIRYGEPLYLHRSFDPERHADPEVLERAAGLVAGKVNELLEQGLRERKGIFR